MKRHPFAAEFMFALTLVTGVAGSATSGEPVPLKGSLEGVRISSAPLNPPFVLNSLNVTGNATHLGRFDLTMTLIVNTTDMTSMGTYEFVASNGDTLTAEFDGTAEATSTPSVVSIVETATITGGTGRFAGATGGIVCKRLFDRASGLTVGTFDGAISSPGANY